MKRIKSNFFRIIFLIFIVLISAFYFILRLIPLYNQTVIYTYDQGRDFLKTAEVFLYKNPTFIGPTTGIMGLYHGAWWYYLLGIPFVIFNGLPIGFYYFIFLIHTLSIVLILFFLKKYFGLIQAFLFLTLITFSSYFIKMSTFAINTTIVLPFLLIFLASVFLLIERVNDYKKSLIIFLNTLALGFILEFEFAFGLFLIPIYFFGVLIFKNLRKIYLNRKSILAVFLGLLLPLSLRILFELKHGFIQTKVLLNFFIKPKFFNPKPYRDIIFDRLQTFLNYYKSIFPNDLTAWIIILILIFALFLFLKNKLKLYKKTLVFFGYLFVMLFIFSTLYKDNFWSYYYEGIQYLILFLIIIFFSPLNKKFKPTFNLINITLIIIITFFGINSFIGNIKLKKEPEGLITLINAVNYIQSHEPNLKNYCVRVYTPPVIPYTYQYLFLYNEFVYKKPQPRTDWNNNRCWIIMEKEQEGKGYQERIIKWRKENIPNNAILLNKKNISEKISLELWKIK